MPLSVQKRANTTFISPTSPQRKIDFSLDYEVQHYIFGMDQMLFLTLIVVGICVAGIAVFVAMSKHP
jgi:hypothetical protein